MQAVPHDNHPPRRRRRRAEDLSPLWRALRERNDQQARSALIEAHLPLVYKTRERVVPRVPVRIAVEDLESAGLAALVLSVDRFEPRRGVKFSSYAIAMIRGAMLEHLRQEDWVPRSVRVAQKEARALEERGEPVPEALREKAQEITITSLEAVLVEGEEFDPLLAADVLRAPDDPAADAEAAQFRERVRLAVHWLPAGEREVILRHWFDGETLKQIARAMGRCESRAHQIHAQALARLTALLEAAGVPAP